MPGDISSCVANRMGVAGCQRELMQVQAAIPEPRFNHFRCVHRDLVFRGGPSDSVWILFGFFWILFRFCFAGRRHSKLRSSFANKTHCFAPFRVTSGKPELHRAGTSNYTQSHHKTYCHCSALPHKRNDRIVAPWSTSCLHRMQTAEMMEMMSLNPDILRFLNSIAHPNTVQNGTQTEDAGTVASKEHAKTSLHAWPQPHTVRSFTRNPTPNV